jgi:hypothetical protein
LLADRPDIVWILPWNLRDEISGQLASVADWGGQLFVAIPQPEVFEPGSTASASIGSVPLAPPAQ